MPTEPTRKWDPVVIKEGVRSWKGWGFLFELVKEGTVELEEVMGVPNRDGKMCETAYR